MISFLKTCGRGCLVIISSPLWLLLFASYVVYGLLLFIYLAVKGFVRLFSTKKLTLETEYDIKAREILSNPSFDPRTGTVQSRPDIFPGPTPVQPQPRPYYQNPQAYQPQYPPQYNPGPNYPGYPQNSPYGQPPHYSQPNSGYPVPPPYESGQYPPQVGPQTNQNQPNGYVPRHQGSRPAGDDDGRNEE